MCRELVNIGGELVSGPLEEVGNSEDSSDGGDQLDRIVRELGKMERLSPEQVSLCQYRHMLLSYLDRLDTYEVRKIAVQWVVLFLLCCSVCCCVLLLLLSLLFVSTVAYVGIVIVVVSNDVYIFRRSFKAQLLLSECLSAVSMVPSGLTILSSQPSTLLE